MKKVYAVLDTNVLVSALLKPESLPGQVLRHALVGKIMPLLDERILAEYTEVLHRKKFKFDSAMVSKLLIEYGKCAVYVNATPSDEPFTDTDDIVFYEVVMEKRENGAYLVTGNLKHYPEEPFIITPREMLNILDELSD